MLASPARWQVAPRDPAAERRLSAALGIPAVVAALLVRRGYTEPEEADRFLHPKLEHLHPPTRLPDYAPARDAILGARERGERIYIHGDYDVDGVTSASLLHRFLESIGAKVQTHVPHRMKEGYGIHESAVAAAAAAGAKLFLTCDCGVAAHTQVEAARALGMRVVVTDHHSIGDSLPSADAVINPHRSDSEYPWEELSGVGVAFKLCEGLTEEVGFKKEQYYRAFLDLAALGTIADVMPLRDENRILARFGLERLAETRKPGLKALMEVAELKLGPDNPLRAYHVGYVLGPRLNAAGRIDDAALALQLLLTKEEEEARRLATEIDAINRARREEQNRILEEAVQQVLDDGLHERNVIIVKNEGWHAGVVGIVAGRLVERFRRPVFVMTVDPETGQAKGSARTIPNFHLAEAIRAHPDLFTTGGGHAMAAGCSFPAETTDQVAEALHQYAGGFLTEADFLAVRAVDLEVDPGEVTPEAVAALKDFEPYGCDNPEPTFAASDIELLEVLPTRNPEHARATLKPAAGRIVPSIAFGIGENLAKTPIGSRLDLVFVPTLDTFRGNTTLKWQIKDFEPR